jgi:hypothetical protein
MTESEDLRDIPGLTKKIEALLRSNRLDLGAIRGDPDGAFLVLG